MATNDPYGTVSQETQVNAQAWQAFLAGDYHVAYACIGLCALAILGFILPEHDHWILWLFVFGLGLGILVDTWAHGYFH